MDQRNLNRILKRLEDQLQHAYSNKRNPTNYRDVYPTNPELKRWNNFLQRKENVMRAGPSGHSSTSAPSSNIAPGNPGQQTSAPGNQGQQTSVPGNQGQQTTTSAPIYPGQQNQSVTHLTKMDMEDRIKKYWEFQCPTFELVLLDFFKGFPDIIDMSSNLTIHPSEFIHNITKAVKTYQYLKNGRLALLQWMEDTARYIVTRKHVCPATKFQHAIIYVIRRELHLQMKQNNGTLYSNMATVLKNNNKYDELLLQDIIKALYSDTFAELVLELERREFPELDDFLEALYTHGISAYLKSGYFPDETELARIFNQSTSIYTRPFRCTKRDELIKSNKRVIEYILATYNQQSNHLASKIFPILEEKFREHFPGSPMNFELHHNLSTVIHQYAESVLKVMKLYYNRIEDMNNMHDLFKGSLDMSQMHTVMKIQKALKFGGGAHPGKDWVNEVKSVLYELKKYVVEPSKVSIQELINKLQKLVDDHMYLK